MVQGRHLVQQRQAAGQILDGEVQEAEAGALLGDQGVAEGEDGGKGLLVDVGHGGHQADIFGYCLAPRAQGCCEGGAITGMDLQLEVQQTN